MTEYKCKSPILFITFTKEKETKLVFEKIREVKPSKLYIASDGARAEKQGEKEKIEILRNWLVANVDWNCEVRTKFNEQNMGCGRGVSSAISWFFENEEMGIILEDDCLPSLSFFYYCDELLNKYKDDTRIYHIAGNNPLTYTKTPHSYYFARIQHCWGWASWRRAWEKYSFDIDKLDDFVKQKKINKIFTRSIYRKRWIKTFKRMERHEIDTWDYQWTYTIFNNGGICINPAKNLITNIGFGPEATHTFSTDTHFHNQERYEISDILHPKKVVVDKSRITLINETFFGIKRKNVITNLIKIIKKIKQSNSKKTSYGNENPDKTFYILGRDWGEGGLMAIIFYSLSHFIYAERKKYYAIMDLKNYGCQYTQKDMPEIGNAWEYYFEQPFNYSLEDVKKSKNILKQDNVLPKINDCIDWRFVWEKNEEDRNNYMNFLREKFRKYIRFSPDVRIYLEKEFQCILEGKNNVLGVLCRGTDYIMKKPENHPIQPEPQEAIEIAEKIISERKCPYIYLATEDSKIYEMFRTRFGSMLLSNNQLRFNSGDFNGKNVFLSEVPKNRRQYDAYNTGLEYLSTLYLLSKCSCFFGGITGGTIGVLCMTDGFEYEYLYYKGLYPSKRSPEL